VNEPNGPFTGARRKSLLDPTATELTGRLSTVRFHRDGFMIGMLDSGIVVKGPMLEPRIGAEYTFTGRVDRNPKWGDQFLFAEHVAKVPEDMEAFRAYLHANAKWVGPKISAAIVLRFGADAVRVCREDPARVAAEVSGVTPERAAEISAMLRGIETDEALELEVRKLLVGSGLGQTIVVRIIRTLGADAVATIKSDPYRLIESIDGIGFLKADKVALNVGYERDGPYRLRAGLTYVLEESAGDGHVCLPQPLLIQRTAELLQVQPARIAAEVEWMVTGGRLVKDAGHIYLPNLHKDEVSVATRAVALLLGAVPWREQDATGLAADQRDAIEKAARNPVFAMTGAPGTGKTYTIKRIVRGAHGRVALAAPTGKAAKRIEEQLQQGADPLDLPASTMHRLLETRPAGATDAEGRPVVGVPAGRGFVFTRTADRPIDADTIIIDETSMVDVTLMARFLEAVKPGTRLVLVGDMHQLPAVGPGNVLGSLIASKRIPYTELQTIKRQDPGLIIRNCHAIKDGRALELAEDWSQDFVFVRREEGPESIREAIVQLVTVELPQRFGADPFADVQVIVPMRERTALSAAALNEQLRAVLNPEPVFSAPAGRFRVGDKVIQTRNDYTLDVMNGEVGRVRALRSRDGYLDVEFDTPARLVAVPWQNNLELAYALTCHKFQGSEAKYVVVPVARTFGVMVAQRQWLYTACSRARKVLVLVGEREEVARVVARNHPRLRHTRLGRRIMEMVATEDAARGGNEPAENGREDHNTSTVGDPQAAPPNPQEG